MRKNNSYFPLFVNLSGKRVIVCGGGAIAYRRVKALLSFGACVCVYAPRISVKICGLKQSFAAQLILHEHAYRPGSLAADLVLSATDDPQVDQEIYQECKKKGIPVNIASDQTKCDFFFPALAKWDEMVVGISSGGQNPSKVRWFAEKIREFLGGLEWK